MPKFLEAKLKREYGANSSIPYAVMNRLGAMRGNVETAKGRAMQAKHERDMRAAPDPAAVARAARKTVRFPGGKPTLAAIIGRRRPKA
jgi:hypothetical protein